MSDPVVMRDIVIIGGGCYGSFYTGQLVKARDKNRARFRQVLVVDRDPGCRAGAEFAGVADVELVVADWTTFFDAFFERATVGAGDYIVPSPLMPHLMFEWVLRRARARWPGRQVTVEPLPEGLGTPYDRSAPDGTRYVSFAEWICPTHCIEPAVCPAIGRERDWEMGDAVRTLVDRARDSATPLAGPALFVCRHHVFGVGTFAVDQVVAGDAIVAQAGASGADAQVVVATISSCHGAVNVVKIGR